ncbi:DUF333 domain-containing protein [Sphingomonas sp. LaA6.9]|uniref:putative hemolysin n=1 Tax=Sphingomonas sp. LaA6.9 TaxID=2919914 RepID=UPI001F4FA03C|nr:DUF333 domain-containing protein [Sphingomonas sp. LaA6.9]MCJ8156205.1 DUF333 domain-containing protein [Sphingomonas sp. LaA6.9]
MRDAIRILALTSLLAACAAQPSAPEPGSVGMPNPAAVHCTDLGGKVEIVTGPDGGQTGICHLPDGRQCEEWALFRDKTCVAKPE